MKKYNLFPLFAAAVTLAITACQTPEPVNVVKEPATKTEYVPIKNAQTKNNSALPANVTAVCVDGSYSTSPVEEACLGNGGARQIISRYHSE